MLGRVLNEFLNSPYAGVTIVVLAVSLFVFLHWLFWYFNKDTQNSLKAQIKTQAEEIEKLKARINRQAKVLTTFEETTLKDSVDAFFEKLSAGKTPVDQATMILRNLTAYATDDDSVRKALKYFFQELRSREEQLGKKNVVIEWDYSPSKDVVSFSIDWVGLRKPVTHTAWIK